jgi:hypothetical protein
MGKKLIIIMLLALILGVAGPLFFNIKSAQAKPPYLTACYYDPFGRLLFYGCGYEASDSCNANNC